MSHASTEKHSNSCLNDFSEQKQNSQTQRETYREVTSYPVGIYAVKLILFSKKARGISTQSANRHPCAKDSSWRRENARAG